MQPQVQPITTAVPSSGTEFFGHPRGLATLFFTEFWERFSYYGMRALLVLFMTAAAEKGGLGYSPEKAGAIYGLYTAMVYLMALPGGWIADKIFGQRQAVLYGSFIITAGHICLAIKGETTFFLGLILIVLGTGLLKPNISVMVGGLYPEGGARRDAGFSIFYMGINLGAFFAPLACGYLGENVDWHLGFGLAAIGMMLGIVQYVAGGKYLGETGLPTVESKDGQQQSKVIAGVGAGIIVASLALTFTGIIPVNVVALAQILGVVIVSIAIAYFAFLLLAGGLNTEERKRVLVVGALFIFSALFWSAFEQAGSSLTLFTDKFTDTNLAGFAVPVSWLQSVNPILIICLAPVFAWLWVALGSKEPSLPVKFALGLLFVGISFFVMMTAASLAVGGGGDPTRVSMLWLVLTYFLQTVGELCLSPVGLSAMTKLAPQRMVGQVMGIWFISVSLGSLIAGQVAGQFEKLPLPQIFGTVALVAGVAGLVLLLFAKPIKNLMGDVK